MAKRNRKKLNPRRTIITLASAYVICHLIWGGISIADLKLQQHQLNQELQAAYTTQAELERELDYMGSEDAMEKMAREKLGLVRDGEILVQTVGTVQVP